jgi:hypothetical protein
LLTDSDLIFVQEIGDRLPKTVTLQLSDIPTPSSFGNNIARIAYQLSGVTMNRILVEPGSGSPTFPGKPSLSLASDGIVANIHYMAAPEGPELKPFMEAVGFIGNSEELSETEKNLQYQEDRNFTNVDLFVAPSCPHCPSVVSTAISAAISNPWIRLNVIDALEFTEIADQFKIKSTPTIIINKAFTIVGQVSMNRLMSELAKSRADDNLTESLKSMVDNGRADDAASLLCLRGAPQAALPMFKSREFSTRLGALVMMEEALQIDPQVFDGVLDDLTVLLHGDDHSLRGDTAELLGKIGNPLAIPALKKALVEDNNPDVRDAIVEALASLENKAGQ